MGRPRKLTAAAIARAAGITPQAAGENPHVKRKADGSIDVASTVKGLELIEASQARKESALADLREIELQERRGNLIGRADVEEQAFKAARIVREGMLAIPDRLAHLLAAESDPAKIHAAMTEEIRKVLVGCSEQIATAA